MSEKRKVNRRTKEQIAVDNTMATLSTAGIAAESEEGIALLAKVRESIKNTKSTKVDPKLSEAKKARLVAKRNLVQMNNAAKAFMATRSLLTKENIDHAINTFNDKNNEVTTLGGDEMLVSTSDLSTFMEDN